MARIPIFNAGGPPSDIAQAPMTANPATYSRPYDELANQVGQLNQADQAAYEKQRQGVNRLGNLYTENSFYAKQPDTTAKAAAVIASAGQNITETIAHAAKVKELQDQAIDLGNRKQAATKETLDWVNTAKQQYQGENAPGFTDAAKQKMQEITDKYSQGLSGIPLTKFQLYRLSDYETVVKGAASQEAAQHTGNVTAQTQNAITDAVAMGAQASAPEDVDKVLTNMGAQIDSLNPNTDNTLLKKQAAQKVVDGIVRVMGAQRNFDGAQSIVSRYKDLGIVDPTAQANLFTLQRQAASEDEARAKQAERDAKEEMKDNQDNLFFKMYSEFKSDPRAFAGKINPPMISAMVENHMISPAQGRSVVNELFGAKRSPDPYVLDEAGQHMANGTLSLDWIRSHSGGLDWETIRRLQDHVTADVNKSVDGRDLNLYVRDMFKNQIFFHNMDPEGLQGLHTSEVKAQDIATKALKEGIPVDAIKSYVQLNFSPEIGKAVSPSKNRFFTTYPATVDEMNQHYKQLYDSAKGMDDSEFSTEWGKLNAAMSVVRQRQEFQQQLDNSGWKDKIEQLANTKSEVSQ